MDVRERVCTSKRRYRRLADAQGAADRTATHNGGSDHRAYRCPLCRGWHVGRPPAMATLRELARLIRGLA